MLTRFPLCTSLSGFYTVNDPFVKVCCLTSDLKEEKGPYHLEHRASRVGVFFYIHTGFKESITLRTAVVSPHYK